MTRYDDLGRPRTGSHMFLYQPIAGFARTMNLTSYYLLAWYPPTHWTEALKAAT